jgi:hypothetical protein
MEKGSPEKYLKNKRAVHAAADKTAVRTAQIFLFIVAEARHGCKPAFFMSSGRKT